jgi:hypothetical protein
MKPYPTYVLASAAHKTVFGIDNGITEQRVNFEKIVAQYHTESEMKHIISECIPKMFDMEAGEVYTPRLEFKTPTGLRMYDVIIRNIGRSCMAIVFNESSDYTNTWETWKLSKFKVFFDWLLEMPDIDRVLMAKHLITSRPAPA